MYFCICHSFNFIPLIFII
ncbi:CRISPR-associated DxTHG motif protein [Clostridium botulinum C/D]|nr:CRISPR-associated DxTHG motif protein [Clostridium botulinum C/D]NFQ87749.1 CRISPR-associated DxTHG motif protein [Clostridium botulinum]MCD3203362.1 CRISPR-associated DxTHG motif protein [Clostridium botulinum C/D]MCD3209902.1 CRISPR-associated DxTHG motif protein [Clostridium botulinum C/D]MCD3212956.1 CRISPR-associated DxTHG motif protein [Clostridium botulinum C/D]